MVRCFLDLSEDLPHLRVLAHLHIDTSCNNLCDGRQTHPASYSSSFVTLDQDGTYGNGIGNPLDKPTFLVQRHDTIGSDIYRSLSDGNKGLLGSSLLTQLTLS